MVASLVVARGDSGLGPVGNVAPLHFPVVIKGVGVRLRIRTGQKLRIPLFPVGVAIEPG